MTEVIDIPPASVNQPVKDSITEAEAALAESRKIPLPENPQIASQMIELGDLYRNAGQIEKTIALFEEALNVIEQYASDTASYYRIAHEIGAIHDTRGDSIKACRFYEEALRIAETGRGVDACEVATIHNNLAMTYKGRGKIDLAESHYHRALEIYERVRGTDHPEVAAMLNNLGALYIAQKDFEMAEVMHLRALGLRQKAYGGNHPDVAQSFSNLAVVYHSRQNWKKAGNYYRDALDVLGKQARTDWDEYSIVLRNYADFLRQTGKPKKADELEGELNQRLEQIAANAAAAAEPPKA
ncbi:MAG TPA: tetratricopeptide repeat protein [Chthoniobacterales bacterium]